MSNLIVCLCNLQFTAVPWFIACSDVLSYRLICYVKALYWILCVVM